MTQNQLRYWELKETNRHNTTTENETNRHNVATERETFRSNLAQERYNMASLYETRRLNTANIKARRFEQLEQQRHNKAGEAYNLAALNETHAQNIRNIMLQSATLRESARHNTAVEAETHRSNVRNEQINIDRNKVRAEIERGQLIVDQLRQIDTQRLNDYQRRQISAAISKIGYESAKLQAEADYTRMRIYIEAINAAGNLLRGLGSTATQVGGKVYEKTKQNSTKK